MNNSARFAMILATAVSMISQVNNDQCQRGDEAKREHSMKPSKGANTILFHLNCCRLRKLNRQSIVWFQLERLHESYTHKEEKKRQMYANQTSQTRQIQSHCAYKQLFSIANIIIFDRSTLVYVNRVCVCVYVSFQYFQF